MQPRLESGPQSETTVLRARARELARPLAPASAPAPATQSVLVFATGSERYGVDTVDVAEVVALPNLTPVPLTPPTIVGVMNHRGRILPIVDLVPLFGPPRPAPVPGAPIVVVSVGDVTLGLLTDDVVGVASVLADTASLVSHDEEGWRGIARRIVADGLVLLDIGKLASDQRVAVDQTP